MFTTSGIQVVSWITKNHSRMATECAKSSDGCNKEGS